MACECCPSQNRPSTSKFRKALWIALIINLTMFMVEMVGGAYAHSSALWADALDFFGDAVNYGVALLALGFSLLWRARVAWLKGATMFIFGLIIIAKSIFAYTQGIVPEPITMGWIGALALCANVVAALVLYAFRDGDANMQSVWLCSRNDAIGNVAVIFAAFGIFGTGSILPDLIVALIMSVLSISAGLRIMKTASLEIRSVTTV